MQVRELSPKEEDLIHISCTQKLNYPLTMDDPQPSDGQDIRVSTIEIQETTALDECGHHSKPILVRRMFEVFCISIHPDPTFESMITYPKTYKLKSVYDGNPCHIYGLVRVFSQDGLVLFDIYNREEDNFEIVEFGGFLSITDSHVISPTYLKVVVYLYDMAHDAEIANGVLNLDYRYDRYNYDELQVQEVAGRHGFASVSHSTFQHAIVANVERVVLNKIDESGSDANDGMLSKVSARLERTYSTSDDYRIYKDEAGGSSFPSSTGDPLEEFPSSILYNNRNGSSEAFEFGVPVKLLRSSIVVPSFCSVAISFHDNADGKIVEDISFDVRDGSLIEISSKGQCCELVLEGKWRQGYASEPTQLVLSDKQSSSNIASAIPKAFPCVEIFSVLVWLDDDYVDISGTVAMMDSSRGPFHIFEGQETWLSGTTLPIIGPPCSFDNHPFKFQIQIQDDKKRFVSKGFFEWNIEDDDDGSMSFYNKLLCSVVRGEVGYAAVHYSVITYGIQAKISVSLFRFAGIRDFSVEVSGKITAEYGGYSYPTLYDREYYKSTLFSKSQTECVQVDLRHKCIELPLTKSVISVPLDELLVLDVNLIVLSPARDDRGNIINESEKISEVVKERLKFGTDVDSFYDFSKNEYSIKVSVDLSDKRYVS